MNIFKKRRIVVAFDDKFYNIVRSVVDYYSLVTPFGYAHGTGIFEPGVQVYQLADGTTCIKFILEPGDLNRRLCMRTLHDMKKFGIITKIKEI